MTSNIAETANVPLAIVNGAADAFTTATISTR